MFPRDVVKTGFGTFQLKRRESEAEREAAGWAMIRFHFPIGEPDDTSKRAAAAVRRRLQCFLPWLWDVRRLAAVLGAPEGRLEPGRGAGEHAGGNLVRGLPGQGGGQG